jgi:hypothetical protein
VSLDASHSSLSDRIRSLNFAPDLREVLAELADRTEQEPAAHEAEYEAMIDRARQSASAAPARCPRHKRDRHGMYLIPGGAAVAALILAAWRWAWRSGAHQAVTTAVAAAVVSAATVPVAVSVMPYGSPAGSPLPAAARHLHSRHDQSPAASPVMEPPRRRRKRAGHHHVTEHARVRSAVSPPVPSPTATDPVPSPTPTDPDPSPSPTESSSGPVGQAVNDVRGLLAPPWPNMLQHGRRGNAAPG